MSETATIGEAAAGSGPASDAALYAQVRRLVGFDADAVAGDGTVVAVAAVDGVDTDELIDVLGTVGAIRPSDPALVVRRYQSQPGRPVTSGPDAAGVGLLVVEPSSSADDDEVRLLGTLRARFGTVALVC
ncbi:MAG: hypothetical protein QM673_15940, partial [Gordonia sp. (in: high G+C Gram-positive bacteria)]